MKKRILFVMIFVCLLSFGFSQEEEEGKEGSLSGEYIKAKLLVFNLKAINVDKGLADAVTENIILGIKNLSGVSKIEVLERSSMKNVFLDHNMLITDAAEFETAIKVARLIESDFALIGSISKLGVNFTLNIRMVRVDSNQIVIDETFYFTGEDQLPEYIDKTCKKITQYKMDQALKTKSSLESYKKVAVTYFSGKVPELGGLNFVSQLKSSLPKKKKYIAVDEMAIREAYGKLNQELFSALTQEEIERLGKQTGADYVVYGNIKKEETGYFIDTNLMDVANKALIFKRTFFTRKEDNLINVGDKIADLINNDKELVISDKIFDYERETLLEAEQKYTRMQKRVLATAFALIGVGGTAIVTAVPLTVVYLYRRYNQPFLYWNSADFYSVTENLSIPVVGLYVGGVVLSLAGSCLTVVAYTTFQKKRNEYRKLADELKTVYLPILDFNGEQVIFGLNIKF